MKDAELVMVGPCPGCGAHVHVLSTHLEAIGQMALALHPETVSGSGVLGLDIDAFDIEGVDWTEETVPLSALAKVAAAIEVLNE
jgi:hypothetical protein